MPIFKTSPRSYKIGWGLFYISALVKSVSLVSFSDAPSFMAARYSFHPILCNAVYSRKIIRSRIIKQRNHVGSKCNLNRVRGGPQVQRAKTRAMRVNRFMM